MLANPESLMQEGDDKIIRIVGRAVHDFDNDGISQNPALIADHVVPAFRDHQILVDDGIDLEILLQIERNGRPVRRSPVGKNGRIQREGKHQEQNGERIGCKAKTGTKEV